VSNILDFPLGRRPMGTSPDAGEPASGTHGAPQIAPDTGAGRDLEALSSFTEVWAELTAIRGDMFTTTQSVTSLCKLVADLTQVVERQGEQIADLQADLAHRELESEYR
jgi:hypothetical protein